MNSADDLIEEKAPRHFLGVHDPIDEIIFWVFSDTRISFNEAKQCVARFVPARARRFDLTTKQVCNRLPPHVVLVVGQDGHVRARHLPDPELGARK